MKANSIKIEKKGFAMLFAVLTAGFLITIGISIFSISLKELMISNSIKDSQMAFYAADSARECFNYWYFSDDVFSPFKNNDDGSMSLKTGDELSKTITCNGVDILIELSENEPLSYGYKSEGVFFKYETSSGPEAKIDFTINLQSSLNVGGDIIYDVDSLTSIFYGYNTDRTGRRVERKYTEFK